MQSPKGILNYLAWANTSTLNCSQWLEARGTDGQRDGGDQLLMWLNVCREEKRLQVPCKPGPWPQKLHWGPWPPSLRWLCVCTSKGEEAQGLLKANKGLISLPASQQTA